MFEKSIKNYEWKQQIVNLVIFCVLCSAVSCAKLKLHNNNKKIVRNNNCAAINDRELRTILGAAYNPRYMSIQEPQATDVTAGNKRTIGVDSVSDFYVGENFVSEIGDDQPAWDVDNFDRKKRNTADRYERIMTELNSVNEYGVHQQDTPWSCPSRIKWIDLGRDYFPRYLRSIECLSHDCWYGHYTCKPRSFAVKILRRRAGSCVNVAANKNIGQEGLPHELRQLWVWEERAVNFCCDCSP